MEEKPACEHGEKDAIGVQSFGYRFASVCQDHACSLFNEIHGK